MNPIDAYARSVVSGERPAGKYHQLACARHLRDRQRESTPEFPYRFDFTKAERFVRFVSHLRHYKGEWAGKPVTLEPWQLFILGSLFAWVHVETDLRRFRYTYFEIPRKNGKALALDTDVPTPDGWTTIGAIRPGDQVFGPDGLAARVVAVTENQANRPCFRVSFADGAEFIADAEHEWRVFDVWREREVVATTAQLADSYRIGNRGRNEYRYRVPVAQAIACQQRAYAIDPYVLGVWLGDGHSAGARVTTADAEILDQLKAVGERVTVAAGQTGAACLATVGASEHRNRDRAATLHARLRVLGVLNNKHIPPDYLRGSSEQRLSLLQGLMDTDGSVSFAGRRAVPRCEFSTTSERLRDGSVELIRSLGMKPTVLTYTARLNGKACGDVFRVCFTAYADTPVFRLSRKLARLAVRPAARQRSSTRSVVSVEPAESVPVKCIQVDRADGLYLAGRHFVTTHNSTIAATAALYITFFDGEPGAEGYCIGTKREQARIVFNDAKKMVEASGFKTRVKVRVSNMHRADTACKLEPLGADADSTDGLNPHLVVIDEWHAFKNRNLVDVMETATGARRQPVIFGITTAGDDPVSPGGDQHDYACKVLDDVLQDESLLAFITHLDEDDDPFDERVWPKSNPNWGVSVKPDDMRALANKARNMPAAAATFKQKRNNLWVNTATPWLAMDGWKRAQTTWTAEDMAGEPCWVGIDVSSKIDLTAVVFAFPPHGERTSWRFLLKCFTPEDTLLERERRDRAPYRVWVDQGHLETNPGNRIDQQTVRDALLWGKNLFDVHEIGYDPWNAGNLHVDLQNDGFAEAQITEVPQTFNHMSGPSKDFEADVLDGLVDWGGNPLATWMAANAVVQRDGKDNIQPIKKKSRGRIDGIVAGIIARKLAATSELEEKPWTGEIRSLSEFL